MTRKWRRLGFVAVSVAVLAIASVSSTAHAAGDAQKIPQHEFSFDGPFGKFDQDQLQRGFQVYREVCATCHSLDLINFRNLTDLGYDELEVKALAGTYEVQDGPNKDGEMFMRPGRPSDRIPGPYANVQAATAANGGAYPPDLSLITKARADGSNYVRALLMGYKKAPAGKEVPEGQYYNKYFPGHLLAMPAPMQDESVEYAGDKIPQTVEQYATDVAAFLTWTAEPKLEVRKRTGLRVMLYLLVLTVLFYLTKKKIWSRVKNPG